METSSRLAKILDSNGSNSRAECSNCQQTGYAKKDCPVCDTEICNNCAQEHMEQGQEADCEL